MAFKFEKLLVWQKSLDLTFAVHEITRLFPKEELYVLTSQIKRAADSVCLNIAEGSTGQSDPEQRRFLGMALRSSIEVVACIYVAQKRSIISKENFCDVYEKCEELHRMIIGLRNALKN